MKTNIHTWAGRAMLLTVFSSIFFTSCEEDEKAKTFPEVTTAEVTDVTPTSAVGGGEIVSNGNAEITASGLVYSSTNETPTITDDKTEETNTDGSFTSSLEGLASGTTYHVRAYATNSVGTGYGEVVEFMTGNAAPVASNVNVVLTGELGFEAELTATYTYNDAESDAQEGTTFQWYIANDIAGVGETAIAGATASTYFIKATDEFKYIRVGVTPKAAVGTSTGVQVKSSFIGPIAEAPETVTFMYNGLEVTYAVIISSVTGHKWLDRNLGAQRAATNLKDHLAYGDLFQWGRAADGHQLINWIKDLAPDAGTPVNGTTTNVLSTTDVPDHSLFITSLGSPNDWRSSPNFTLWNPSGGYVNNPCPSGWHIPTNQEWADEHLETDFAEPKETGLITNELKLTASGGRRPDGPVNTAVGYEISYWSSERYNGGDNPVFIYGAKLGSPSQGDHVTSDWQLRPRESGAGLPCRCLKNQ